MAEWPQFASIPPPAVRNVLRNEEWEFCLEAWITLIELRLKTSEKEFNEIAPKDESAVSFLTSFYHQLASSSSADSSLRTGQNARSLRKLCFLLTRRLLLALLAPPVELLEWRFLGDMCCCYPSSAALKRLLSETWNKEKNEETMTSSLEKAKFHIIKQLTMPEKKSANSSPDIIIDIRRVTILSSFLPSYGQVLMTGSDFLDTFFDVYQMQKKEEFRKVLVATVYVGLTSLLKGPRPNLSLLLDQLFSLKAAAKVGTPNTKREPTLLSNLVCSSDLLERLEGYLIVSPQKRGQDLVSVLRSYQMESKPMHRRYQKHKRKLDKGKDRAVDIPVVEELHAHRMSLVTQVQDLFPDLGSAYIIKLLDFYGDNPETIIAHVLDDTLSPELKTLDKSEQFIATHPIPHRDPLSPQPTPPDVPSPKPDPALPHRSAFDEDVDIAELARSGDDRIRGKLRLGRANPEVTADDVLADRSQHAINKAAILSALATFDSDDDERDDTYDVADVGGTVDAVVPGTDADANADVSNRRAEEMDMALFRAYKSSPGAFARDSVTRRSQPRASLKRETGMTDEAIEGWAVMLNRDPKRLSKLEHKLALAAGGIATGGAGGALQQPELRPTAYRKPGPEAEDEESVEANNDRYPSGTNNHYPRGGGRGRGRDDRGRGGGSGGRGGRRGGGGGPNSSSSATEQNPTRSRQKKEENKSSRANHNRRQQRGKKLARVGLPG